MKINLRQPKDIKRRNKFEVFASGGGIIGASYHRTKKAAKKAKESMLQKGGKGVIIYNIKEDKVWG
jgi:hypothetical protein